MTGFNVPVIDISRAFDPRIEERRAATAKRHDALWAKWQKDARETWDAAPVTLPRFALEIWDVIKDEDWVLTANDLKRQVRKLWDFDKPYRHPGKSLGTSTQIGISLGVALAHRGKKRLVVDLQPDGDLCYAPGVLWTAAHHKIPLLLVMHNNRGWHQEVMHVQRLSNFRNRVASLGGDMGPIGTSIQK